MNSVDRITIRAFRAIDQPSGCAAYDREHRRVLEDAGVGEIIGHDASWKSDPRVIVIVAEHQELGLVAGIRLHRARKASELPMTAAIGPHDPRIEERINALGEEGVGEVCGLWNSSKFAGRGVPALLSLAAVSLANQVGVRSLFCFVAHYTLRHARKVGFTLLQDVGKNGEFQYPVEGIRSYAMTIQDGIRLEGVADKVRMRLLSLRTRPVQETVESPAGIPLVVRYILHPFRVSRILRMYGAIQSHRYAMLRA